VDPGDELVDVVDDDDRIVGTVTRREMRARNLLHRCTYVLVLDPEGRIYVHRRTDTKDVYPGMYDMTAGGVCASGESYDEGAARELEEELGIDGVRPRFCFKLRFEGSGGRALGAVYDVVWGGPIRHQETEVAWGAFVPMQELSRMIERERFCPDGLAMFERWRRERAGTV
jgi:isopentenyldiphosphate isomerase